MGAAAAAQTSDRTSCVLPVEGVKLTVVRVAADVTAPDVLATAAAAAEEESVVFAGCCLIGSDVSIGPPTWREMACITLVTLFWTCS